MKCRKVRTVIAADVVAWGAVVAILATNPGPDSPLRLPFFMALHLAMVLLAVALMPWLFADVLQRLFEKYVRDYFGVYVTGYLKGAASTTDEDNPTTLTLVEGGRRR